MKYTSAEAGKLLRKLNEDKARLEYEESCGSVFNAAMGENPEEIRPSYNYADTQNRLDKINSDIRKVKHAINRFNISHEVGDTGMTVDQVLVYIPQLTERKAKLYGMSIRLPKERAEVISFGKNSTIIDYTYANYCVETAKEDYERVSEQLSKVQTALDLLNNTETIEIDIE